MSSSQANADFALPGRVAVIVGGASGFGRETARVLAEAGASIVLSDIDRAGLDETASLVSAAGGKAIVSPADVSVRADMEALADTAIAAFGRLDIWFNSAGVALWSDVVSVATARAERTIAINLMGTYWATAAAGRVMMQQGGGSIINISSTAGSSPVPGLAVYGMAKAGVDLLTRVCAAEFGPSKVRVNAISPGWCDTPINADQYRDSAGEIDPGLRASRIAEMAALSPLGIVGTASDIACAALYLASDASRFVTGQVLRVSGGV